MADYFASLAARTLRPEPSVQPRPHVLWEEAAKPMAGVLPATEEQTADRARPTVSDEAEPPRRSRRKSTGELRSENEPVAQQPRQQRSKRRGASDRDDSHGATAPTPHPTVRALEPMVQIRFERVAARPGDAPGQKPAVASERAATMARAGRIEPAHPIPTRLSARERASTAEPAVRIHIGRVDVRAVTTAVPGSSPPATRDSTRGLMSLDEYVQKRDRGVS